MLGPDNLTLSGEWSDTGKGKNGEDVTIKGYWSTIYRREGEDWAHLRFVKILVPEISESVVLDHDAEGQEIT